MQSPALFCAVSILLSAGFVKKILGRKADFCLRPAMEGIKERPWTAHLPQKTRTKAALEPHKSVPLSRGGRYAENFK